MKLANALLCLLALAAPAVLSADLTALAQLPQARFPQENRVVSGALEPDDPKVLSEAGVRHVVDLQLPAEHKFDEPGAVAAQGMEYHSIPIDGAASLTRENAAKLDAVLEQIGDEPALVHCASGNRVGALVALRAGWLQGASVQEALQEGERWGLAALEPTVRQLLEGDAARHDHDR